ncbi:MAG: hypothetical protein ACR652_19750 [Methylocystis sp.]|uniref:hypothetical protein n=1 Tax=Methylocystis sp. TaxID=1911079 RepID=UPI003DA6702F
MKAIVCGGRNVGRARQTTTGVDAGGEIRRASAERKFVADKMSELHAAQPFTRIVGGNEGGAERLATHWATINGVPMSSVERRNSRETTIQRNMRMLKEHAPELVVAFGGGESTEALLAEAQRTGVAVLRIDIPEF